MCKKRIVITLVLVLSCMILLLTDSSSAQTLPSSLNWHDYKGENNVLQPTPGDYVTPVRNQGMCGSCWAFGSTATLESRILIRKNMPNVDLDLSEQVLISCGNSGSCGGGEIELASDFFIRTGLPDEACYRYTAKNGTCSAACGNWENNENKISNWGYVPQSLDAIKRALYNYGPLLSTYLVYSDFTGEGIYHFTTGGAFQGIHAVLTVGYNDPEQYFIIKNSWGPEWGESGYFRIGYSELTSPAEYKPLIPYEAADIDGDKIPDPYDNCLNDYNPLQEDSNNNGTGDVCDGVNRIDLGASSGSGSNTRVAFCGWYDGHRQKVVATCYQGSWSVDPCWTSSCSTGWIGMDFSGTCDSLCDGPSITTITQTGCTIGASVDLHGTNLCAGLPDCTSMSVGFISAPGITAPATLANAGQITFTIPAEAKTGPVQLLLNGQIVSSNKPLIFIVQPSTMISYVSQQYGYLMPWGWYGGYEVGDTVYIRGSDLCGGTSYAVCKSNMKIGFVNAPGIEAAPDFVNYNDILFKIPEGALSGPIQLKFNGAEWARSPDDVIIRNCNDGNICTTDYFDLENAICVHESNTLSCDDGNLCTIGNICSNGICGVPKDCNDNDACTSDTCDPKTGNCVHTPMTYYLDADGDGYGNPDITTSACPPPAGYVANNTDCNDFDPAINPGATELCDGIDNNCNGLIDDGAGYIFYRDHDGDGYGDPNMPWSSRLCQQPGNGWVLDHTDCDDNNASVYPGAPEICDNGDNNCNGQVDEGLTFHTYYIDSDQDGYGNPDTIITWCAASSSFWVLDNTDCNDSNASIHPGAIEICDGVDNNCNGQIDEGLTICDDGNACTADSCVAGTCIHTPIVCNDNNACTTDTCNTATGCVFTPIVCNDNNACTTDTCNTATGVCNHTNIVCNDNNACTTDTCDTAKGCVYTPNTSVCPIGSTNNNFTLLDSTGKTIGGANDVTFYWDGTRMTSVAAAGQVTNALIASTCPFQGATWSTHDVAIYGPGTYTVYASCPAGSPGCAGDTNPITFTVGAAQLGAHLLFDWNTNKNIDVVNVWTPNVVFAPSALWTGACGSQVATKDWDWMSTDLDGDGINGKKMVEGPFRFSVNFNLMTPCSTSCDDNNACTTDSCVAGTCVHTPINCDDNNACTVDSCVPTLGCLHPQRTCNDNNVCTTDTCNTATGCVFTNNTLSCNDGNNCTTGDVCSNGVCAGTPINCNDNNICTADSCNIITGCMHTAIVPASCNDNNICTIDGCTNNACTHTAGSCADLTEAVLTTSQSGANLLINDRVTNGGTAAAGAFDISYYLSLDTIYSSGTDTFLCKRSVASLAAGASNPTSGTIQTTCAIPSVPAKGYYVIAFVDAGNLVPEGTETNNTRSVSVTISGIDLVPVYMTAIKSGTTVTVSETVTNQGSTSSAGFTNTYFLSAGNTTYEPGTDIALALNPDGTGTCSRTITSLKAGSSSPGVSKTCYKPSGAQNGQSYYVLVVDDSGNQVTEYCESNNVKATTGTISW